MCRNPQVYESRAVHDDRAARVAVAEHEEILSAVRASDEDAAASVMGALMPTASARLAAGASA